MSMKFTDENYGPWVFVAFISIGLVEIFRYPFYFCKEKFGFTKDTKMTIMLGHLRYTLPLVLFPLGTLCTGVAGLLSLKPIYDQ